jgi:hypothetical protein
MTKVISSSRFLLKCNDSIWHICSCKFSLPVQSLPTSTFYDLRHDIDWDHIGYPWETGRRIHLNISFRDCFKLEIPFVIELDSIRQHAKDYDCRTLGICDR